jgi:putative solute:sodium symporter small subunit
MTPTPSRAHLGIYRKKNNWLSAVLMLVWVVVSFVIPFYARELSWPFFDWPFGFWMAAQGSILIYIVIVVVYAYYMNKLDDQYRQANDTQT